MSGYQRDVRPPDRLGESAGSAGADRKRLKFRCRVDRHGRQHFNFRQRIWLVPGLPMAHTRTPSTALTTLAVNLLSLCLSARRPDVGARNARRRAGRRVITLARQFSDECLLTAPEGGWEIPREAIGAWLESHAHGHPWRRAGGGPDLPRYRR